MSRCRSRFAHFWTRNMAFETEPCLRWLLLDLNSYFASVEQELRPDCRVARWPSCH